MRDLEINDRSHDCLGKNLLSVFGASANRTQTKDVVFIL
jgi:hypothetical protein